MIAFRMGLMLGLMAVSTLFAAVAKAEPQVHRGTVVSAAATKLVVKSDAGAEQSFTVEAEARIVVHGKPGKLEDLQQTMPIQITTDEKGKVLTVATVDKHKRSGEILVVLRIGGTSLLDTNLLDLILLDSAEKRFIY
jgi:hypothetical protein